VFRVSDLSAISHNGVYFGFLNTIVMRIIDVLSAT